MSSGRRFKLKSGHVVIVDEADAYILRSVVWEGYAGRGGSVSVRRQGSSGLGAGGFLSHFLAGEAGKPRVIHLNRNQMDFRRANLKAVSLEECAAHVGKRRKERAVP